MIAVPDGGVELIHHWVRRTSEPPSRLEQTATATGAAGYEGPTRLQQCHLDEQYADSIWGARVAVRLAIDAFTIRNEACMLNARGDDLRCAILC